MVVDQGGVCTVGCRVDYHDVDHYLNIIGFAGSKVPPLRPLSSKRIGHCWREYRPRIAWACILQSATWVLGYLGTMTADTTVLPQQVPRGHYCSRPGVTGQLPLWGANCSTGAVCLSQLSLGKKSPFFCSQAVKAVVASKVETRWESGWVSELPLGTNPWMVLDMPCVC